MSGVYLFGCVFGFRTKLWLFVSPLSGLLEVVLTGVCPVLPIDSLH